MEDNNRIVYLDKRYLGMRQNLETDNLRSWLQTLKWNDVQRKRIDQVLADYYVSHSRDSFTIFWQIDEEGNLHRGLMKFFNLYGVVEKSDSINERLYKAGLIDIKKQIIPPCFFGQHLLTKYPEAKVNIVESEVDAIMMSIYWEMDKQEIFLATSNYDILLYTLDKPLFQGRKIGLYPSLKNIEKWQTISDYYHDENIQLRTKFIERVWRPEDGNDADYKTIFTHMMEDRQAGRMQRVEEIVRYMIAENPFFEDLIKSLKLTPI